MTTKKNTRASAKSGAGKRKQASRQKAQAPRRPIGRYLVLTVIIVGCGLRLSTVDWRSLVPDVHVNKEVAITNIKIEGVFTYSSQAQVKAEISALLEDDFVRLDITHIQQALLLNPWYKHVAVNRVWPSSLKVKIEEQQPIARWGTTGFINRYGEVVTVEDSDVLSSLPTLKGKDDQAYDIAKEYLNLSRLLGDKQLYISALSVSEQGDWRIEVDGKFIVELGDSGITQRVERFLYLYTEQLESINNKLERVDMRYQNGVAVKWTDAASSQVADIADNSEIVSR